MANDCTRCIHRVRYTGTVVHWCARTGVHIEDQVVDDRYAPDEPAPYWCPGMEIAVNDKPWRVITPTGTAWVVRFTCEEAAWGRLLASRNIRLDTRANRLIMENEGWKVKEVTSAEAGNS